MNNEDKKYIETVGRRKTSVARVRITEAAKTTYLVNDKELADYFPTAELQRVATRSICNFEDPRKI